MKKKVKNNRDAFAFYFVLALMTAVMAQLFFKLGVEIDHPVWTVMEWLMTIWAVVANISLFAQGEVLYDRIRHRWGRQASGSRAQRQDRGGRIPQSGAANRPEIHPQVRFGDSQGFDRQHSANGLHRGVHERTGARQDPF